ncbi:conserved hypothetical protein [Neospora caninum Liverpool]|uniref:Protease prsW family protein n=1 Tax=Neospora caninum (strain Liverpool) TaxID=572307 RepID=F0VL25_NEOCL|nr:conserved hypothetical protein [Neospora caninum Liverpool]CBZ54777.1 conserved hypothetical protein [Neospora caninum Liverpool]CEL69494.1 TPA: hypothetical protein BN1204_052030 [Neospora caninum Liverpool]|eukprot:XP_003884805.1 conserved hypothetical protein [Neospora caninum Liverpool]
MRSFTMSSSVSSSPSPRCPASPGASPQGAQPAPFHVSASPPSGWPHTGATPSPTPQSPASLSRPLYLPPPYLGHNATENPHAPTVPPAQSPHNGDTTDAREADDVQGCLCCLRSFSPTLFIAAVLGTWTFAGGVAGEIVLAFATLPAMFMVYGLYASAKARSLSGLCLLEFFWLGAFLSVCIAMCLELVANATLYSTFLSCLPPLPSSSSSLIPGFASGDFLNALASAPAGVPRYSADSPSLLEPEDSSAHAPASPLSSAFSASPPPLSLLEMLLSWTPAPLLAPLSLPFSFPLSASTQPHACLQTPQTALLTGTSADSVSSSPFSAPLSAFSVSPDSTSWGWPGLFSRLTERVHEIGSLPTLGCSLSLVAFMILCVGLVEEFAKLVVLHRLQVHTPAALAATGAEAASEQRGANCCTPCWTRRAAHPVGVCLAGCAAGAGFAMAENISYTLGRRGFFAEHLIVALVRAFTAVPTHIANSGMAAANLALAWYSECSFPAVSLSSSLASHQQPLISTSSPFSPRVRFWAQLLPSLLTPSLLHGTYDAALRLSAAYAQPSAAGDDNAAVVASVFLLVSLLAWLLTLLLFWKKWRSVRDLPTFGAASRGLSSDLSRVYPAGPAWSADPRVHWSVAQMPVPLSTYAPQNSPFFHGHAGAVPFYSPFAVAPAFPFGSPAASGAEAGVRADVLVWEERRRQANMGGLGAPRPRALSPAPLPESGHAATSAARPMAGGERGEGREETDRSQ